MQDRLKKQSSAVLILICLVFIAGVKLIFNSFASDSGNEYDKSNRDYQFHPAYYEKVDSDHTKQEMMNAKNSLFNISVEYRSKNINNEAEDLGRKLFQINEKSGATRNSTNTGGISKELFWTIF